MAKPKPEIPKNNKTAGKEGPITFKTILQQMDPQSSLIILISFSRDFRDNGTRIFIAQYLNI